MHLLELVADPEFITDYYGPDMRRDPKPIPRVSQFRSEHRLLETRDQLRKKLRCQVDGCGVDWAPQGVCGYCRNRVRELREERACRATREAA